jgi:hypothetical protein
VEDALAVLLALGPASTADDLVALEDAEAEDFFLAMRRFLGNNR